MVSPAFLVIQQSIDNKDTVKKKMLFHSWENTFLRRKELNDDVLFYSVWCLCHHSHTAALSDCLSCLRFECLLDKMCSVLSSAKFRKNEQEKWIKGTLLTFVWIRSASWTFAGGGSRGNRWGMENQLSRVSKAGGRRLRIKEAGSIITHRECSWDLWLQYTREPSEWWGGCENKGYMGRVAVSQSPLPLSAIQFCSTPLHIQYIYYIYCIYISTYISSGLTEMHLWPQWIINQDEHPTWKVSCFNMF